MNSQGSCGNLMATIAHIHVHTNTPKEGFDSLKSWPVARLDYNNQLADI